MVKKWIFPLLIGVCLINTSMAQENPILLFPKGAPGETIKLIEKENLSQINDKDELIKYIKIEFDKYPDQVEQYIKEDNLSVINFFMGKVMSSTKRQANPNMTRELIKEELERMKMND